MTGYKFQSDWLLRKDTMDHEVGIWCEKFQEIQNHAYCRVCKKNFSHSAKGFSDILQHSSSVKHSKNMRDNVKVNQLTFQAMQHQESNGSQKTVKLWSLRNKTTTAEILWSIRSIHCNMSGNSCDGLGNTFQAMFPDSQIAKDFTLSSTKFRYLVTEALEPYYKSKLIDDVNQSSGFVISYDETTNAECRKELQTRVRYFSEKNHEVIDHHLQTYFLGSATAKILVENINNAMKELAKNKLVMIGSDGPNVNKSVLNMINEQMLTSRNKGLINTGTCNLHIVNNSFVKALSEYGKDVSDFAIDIFYFFHKEPTRIQDYEFIQKKHKLKLHRFTKHSTTRWLTIKPSAILLSEQWPALTEYFLKFLLNKKGIKGTLESVRYTSICKHLRQKDMQAQIQFVISSSTLFETFLKLFQKEEPLIHLMFDKIENLILTLAGRVCSATSVKQFKENKLKCEDLFSEKNFVELKSITLDEKVIIQMEQFSELDAALFLRNIRNHYKKAALHIIEKSSFKAYPQSSILYACRSLQPRKIRSKYSVQDIVKIAEHLPFEDFSSTQLVDEWKLLQLETLPDFQTNDRIDHFWQKNVFEKANSNGELMFPSITKVVKVVLSFSHGNADVERGFSKSKLTLTKDKARMDEKTLNAKLTTHDSTKRFKDQLHLLPITSDLIIKAQFAYSSYKENLEKEKKRINKVSEDLEKEKLRIEEEKENLKKIGEINKNVKELEANLKNLHKEKIEIQKSSNELMENIHNQLQKAVNQKNLQPAHVAKGMVMAVESMRKEEESKEKEILKLTKEIDQKKARVLNNLLKNKLPEVQNNCDKDVMSSSKSLNIKRKITNTKEKRDVLQSTNARENNESEVSTKLNAPKKRKNAVINNVPKKKKKVHLNATIDSFLKNNQEKKPNSVTFVPQNSERIIKKKILMKDLL